jgi:hypothetical protein
MKALSLWQPWASLMAFGFKRIETRGWPTSYRGPLLICSAKHWTEEEKDDAVTLSRVFGGLRFDGPPAGTPCGIVYDRDGKPSFFPLGCALVVVDLVDCRPALALEPEISEEERCAGFYGPNRFGWVTANPRRLVTYPYIKGKQGLFDVDDQVVAEWLAA